VRIDSAIVAKAVNPQDDHANFAALREGNKALCSATNGYLIFYLFFWKKWEWKIKIPYRAGRFGQLNTSWYFVGFSLHMRTCGFFPSAECSVTVARSFFNFQILFQFNSWGLDVIFWLNRIRLMQLDVLKSSGLLLVTSLDRFTCFYFIPSDNGMKLPLAISRGK